MVDFSSILPLHQAGNTRAAEFGMEGLQAEGISAV